MKAPRRRPPRSWQSRAPRTEALRKHDAACDRLIYAALRRMEEDRRVWERQQKEQQA